MQFHFLSLCSAISAIIALFLSGLAGIGAALTGILLAFFASKRKEKGFIVGMLVGAIAMIFLNLQVFGLFPSPAKSEIEKVYDSIRLTNKAYSMLANKESNPDNSEIAAIIEVSLTSAKQVDVDIVDNMVSGFAGSFQGDYIQGFTMLAEGYKEADNTKKLAGGMLVDNWARWNLTNKALMEKARKKTPSLAGYILTL